MVTDLTGWGWLDSYIESSDARFRQCLDSDSDSRLTLKALFGFRFLKFLIPIPIFAKSGVIPESESCVTDRKVYFSHSFGVL